MTTYTSPDRTFDAGVPSQVSDSFAVLPEGFITGETPTQFTQDLPSAASQTLAEYTVVGLDDSGNVVEAVRGSADPADDIQPIGITLYPVTAGSGENPVVRVLRAACINHLWAGLNWPSSFTTAAHKISAFEGAPSPSQFVCRTLAHYTPTAP